MGQLSLIITIKAVALLTFSEAVPQMVAVMPTLPLPLSTVVPRDNVLVLGQGASGITLAKQAKPDCPYCDSSVYPYCSDKLLHDACCCLNPYDQSLPPQCQLADCSFLHANTCKEHRLITRCCCDRLLYIKR